MRALILACMSLAACACGGAVRPTSNINAAGVRVGNNEVAFMGDSITAWWTTLPAADINAGVSGNTTVQMLARFDTDVIKAVPTPGIVVILGGINDMFQQGSGANIESIKAMAAAATMQDMRVILCSVMPEDAPLLDGVVTQAQIEQFNSELIALAQSKGYEYADYYDAFLNADGSIRDDLLKDGLHPNAAGYAVMWDVIEPLIQEASR